MIGPWDIDEPFAPRPMKIAILGTRGIPGSYGGFETFAEQLATRLVERDHDVTVYARNRWVPRGLLQHRGVKIVRLPAPPSKYLETVVHTLLSAIHVAGTKTDITYVCNSANFPAAILLMAFRHRVVLNVDGLEWQRAKWGLVGRSYYRACAWAAARSSLHLVTDAHVIRDYYLRAYGRETAYFPYGTDLEPVGDDGTLRMHGLEPDRYVLYVSRLEPENNADVVIEAYRQLDTDLPLALVGDAPYASTYIADLRKLSKDDPRIRFLGGIYGRGYQILRSHAVAYIQATEVGGTHPALVEAMGYGNAIVANDVPEHREVLGDAGLYYSGAGELAKTLNRVLQDVSLAATLRGRAAERASTLYSWSAITDAYEQWLSEVAGIH
jgi:glycosyltransferase involved in cell wall biosynthesis